MRAIDRENENQYRFLYGRDTDLLEDFIGCDDKEEAAVNRITAAWHQPILYVMVQLEVVKPIWGIAE